MTDPFQSPLFQALGAPYRQSQLYQDHFEDAKPACAGGESEYVNALAAGASFALTATNHHVRAVFLYNQDIEDFSAFCAEALPGDFTLTSRRSDIRAALGEPSLSANAGDGGTGIFAIAFAFDRYEKGPHYLRFDYLEGDAGIRLVTLGLVE